MFAVAGIALLLGTSPEGRTEVLIIQLQEATEKAIIDYTQKGGRLICLHHSISSAKAANKFYFGFLGVRLDKGPMAPGDTRTKHPVGPW